MSVIWTHKDGRGSVVEVLYADAPIAARASVCYTFTGDPKGVSEADSTNNTRPAGIALNAAASGTAVRVLSDGIASGVKVASTIAAGDRLVAIDLASGACGYSSGKGLVANALTVAALYFNLTSGGYAAAVSGTFWGAMSGELSIEGKRMVGSMLSGASTSGLGGLLASGNSQFYLGARTIGTALTATGLSGLIAMRVSLGG